MIPKTLADAICILLDDAMREKVSLVNYQRCIRALKVTGLSQDDANRILQKLEYHNSENVPYAWIDRAKEKAAGKKAGKPPIDLMREVMR